MGPGVGVPVAAGVWGGDWNGTRGVCNEMPGCNSPVGNCDCVCACGGGNCDCGGDWNCGCNCGCGCDWKCGTCTCGRGNGTTCDCVPDTVADWLCDVGRDTTDGSPRGANASRVTEPAVASVASIARAMRDSRALPPSMGPRRTAASGTTGTVNAPVNCGAVCRCTASFNTRYEGGPATMPLPVSENPFSLGPADLERAPNGTPAACADQSIRSTIPLDWRRTPPVPVSCGRWGHGGVAGGPVVALHRQGLQLDVHSIRPAIRGAGGRRHERRRGRTTIQPTNTDVPGGRAGLKHRLRIRGQTNIGNGALNADRTHGAQGPGHQLQRVQTHPAHGMATHEGEGQRPRLRTEVVTTAGTTHGVWAVRGAEMEGGEGGNGSHVTTENHLSRRHVRFGRAHAVILGGVRGFRGDGGAACVQILPSPHGLRRTSMK